MRFVRVLILAILAVSAVSAAKLIVKMDEPKRTGQKAVIIGLIGDSGSQG